MDDPRSRPKVVNSLIDWGEDVEYHVEKDGNQEWKMTCGCGVTCEPNVDNYFPCRFHGLGGTIRSH